MNEQPTQSLYSTETKVATYPDVHERHPEAWKALLKWCRFHGIDPNNVPAAGVIERDVEARCVRYAILVRDENGRLQPGPYGTALVESAIAQGETPPLPWPPEVAALPLHDPSPEY